MDASSTGGRALTSSFDLLVVGAGPTGLTAAAAAGGDRSVLVVDAGSRLGGMAASITVADVRVDLGSHRLHAAAEPAVETMIRRLLGDDLQVRPRHGRMRIEDRWLRFPPHPLDLARHLPPRFVAGAGRDLALAPLRRRRDVDPDDPTATFADVVRARLGPTMLDRFYGPYAEKLWGRPPDELAGELARRRIAAASGSALLARAARTLRSTPPTFRYPRHGYGQLVERLADRAVDDDVAIRLGTTVTRVDPSDDGVTFELTDGTHGTAGRVFWTAPTGPLDRLLGRAERSPASRAVACVFLAYAVDRATEFDAHYLPGPESIAARVSEPKNYRDGPDPTDVTVLCAEVPCDVGDVRWRSHDASLAARVHDDLTALGLTTTDPVVAHVERLPSVYPVHSPADAELLARRRAERVPGITVLGRQGFAVADNIHHVMAMALDAVDCLGTSATAWDDARWQRAVARFDTHVVED